MQLIPNLDLSAIAPVIGLAAIAIVVIIALLLSVLLRSRIVLLSAVVIGVVVAGPALGAVLAQVINSFIGLALVIGASAITALFILHRNPELRAMLHDVLPARPSAVQTPPLLNPGEPGQSITVIDQPAQASRTRTIKSSGDNWGF